MCCYVIFIKYVLVTFTNKQRRIIFKFDVLYVEQLSPSSFIYISKPFSFFFFRPLPVFCKATVPFSAVSAIFFPTYYISVRPYGRCLGNLRLSILLSAFLLHCNKNFLSSRPVNSSSFARSSTRMSPKICHAFFCGIVKVRFPSFNTSQFQTRPIAKPFLRERVLFAWCLHDHFPIKGPRHSLGLKQRLCTSRKRSILVCTGTSMMIIYLSLTAETITRKEAIVIDGQACAVRRGEQCLIFPKILTYIKYHTPLLQYSHRCFSSLLRN